MENLEFVVALSESCREVPWKGEDVDSLVFHLRALRCVFAESPRFPNNLVMSPEECAQVLTTLSSTLLCLLNSEVRKFLDQTKGQDHLVLSVLVQSLVNCLSYMANQEMHIPGEIPATIIAALVYNDTLCNWVFSLVLAHALPLWRVRIGCYSFILITSIITSVQKTGIPSDFAKFLCLAVRCMKVVAVTGGDDVNLLQTWFDQCLFLISALCTSPPGEVYWKHKVWREERIVAMSASLGTILLLHAYEEQEAGLKIPSMKKLAELCVSSCRAQMFASRKLCLDTLLPLLRYCVSRSPFQLCHKNEKVTEWQFISVALPDEDIPQMLGILRGAVYLLCNLLPPIQDTDSPQPVDTDKRQLTDLIFTIGDLLVLVDSLLQDHLAKCEPRGLGRKAPSLMDSMDSFNFAHMRSICFAVDIKQDLIRCLLSFVHSRPQLVSCFVEHTPVTRILCPSSTEAPEVAVSAPDIFWALVNACQRDPASPVAVEWTILLLRLLLKPTLQEERILQAATTMSQRIAQLKPSATLRQQLNSIPGALINFYRLIGVELLLFRVSRGLCSSQETKTPISRLLGHSQMQRLLGQSEVAPILGQILKIHPDFDTTIVKPLLEVAKLHITSILNLIHLALSPDLQKLSPHGFSLETRLQLLQPTFVISQVLNPLLRFGVKNPHRVIRRCPSLFTAAVMRENEETRLLVALATLHSLLTPKELGTLVKNFPSVLTRSREDLEATYDYLTRVMGLEHSGNLHGMTSGRRNAHLTRHSTRLRLAISPAWRLPLRQIVARHTLLLLANQWPPSLPRPVQKSRGGIVGQLLTCSSEQFSYWIEYCDQSIEDHVDGHSFSAADVRYIEKICQTLNSNDEFSQVEDCEDFPDRGSQEDERS